MGVRDPRDLVPKDRKAPRDLVPKGRQVTKDQRDRMDPAPPVHLIVHPWAVTVQARVFTVPMGRNVAVDNIALLYFVTVMTASGVATTLTSVRTPVVIIQ